MQLTANQQRIIGCLLEKQSTTPEHYPLSLNSLTHACNQKSNREPVLSLTEAQVQDTLSELSTLRLVTEEEGLSGRVSKYAHRFCNTQFGSLKLTNQQRAIICLMLLRGPQTPGELRTRSNRLTDFHSVADVEAALDELIAQEYVIKHPREAGKRESRYSHLFTNNTHELTDTEQAGSEPSQLKTQEIDELKAEIDKLKIELQKIKQHLGL